MKTQKLLLLSFLSATCSLPTTYAATTEFHVNGGMAYGTSYVFQLVKCKKADIPASANYANSPDTAYTFWNTLYKQKSNGGAKLTSEISISHRQIQSMTKQLGPGVSYSITADATTPYPPFNKEYIVRITTPDDICAIISYTKPISQSAYVPIAFPAAPCTFKIGHSGYVRGASPGCSPYLGYYPKNMPQPTPGPKPNNISCPKMSRPSYTGNYRFPTSAFEYMKQLGKLNNTTCWNTRNEFVTNKTCEDLYNSCK